MYWGRARVSYIHGRGLFCFWPTVDLANSEDENAPLTIERKFLIVISLNAEIRSQALDIERQLSFEGCISQSKCMIRQMISDNLMLTPQMTFNWVGEALVITLVLTWHSKLVLNRAYDEVVWDWCETFIVSASYVLRSRYLPVERSSHLWLLGCFLFV